MTSVFVAIFTMGNLKGATAIDLGDISLVSMEELAPQIDELIRQAQRAVLFSGPFRADRLQAYVLPKSLWDSMEEGGISSEGKASFCLNFVPVYDSRETPIDVACVSSIMATAES